MRTKYIQRISFTRWKSRFDFHLVWYHVCVLDDNLYSYNYKKIVIKWWLKVNKKVRKKSRATPFSLRLSLLGNDESPGVWNGVVFSPHARLEKLAKNSAIHSLIERVFERIAVEGVHIFSSQETNDVNHRQQTPVIPQKP